MKQVTFMILVYVYIHIDVDLHIVHFIVM